MSDKDNIDRGVNGGALRAKSEWNNLGRARRGSSHVFNQLMSSNCCQDVTIQGESGACVQWYLLSLGRCVRC